MPQQPTPNTQEVTTVKSLYEHSSNPGVYYCSYDELIAANDYTEAQLNGDGGYVTIYQVKFLNAAS